MTVWRLWIYITFITTSIWPRLFSTHSCVKTYYSCSVKTSSVQNCQHYLISHFKYKCHFEIFLLECFHFLLLPKPYLVDSFLITSCIRADLDYLFSLEVWFGEKKICISRFGWICLLLFKSSMSYRHFLHMSRSLLPCCALDWPQRFWAKLNTRIKMIIQF